MSTELWPDPAGRTCVQRTDGGDGAWGRLTECCRAGVLGNKSCVLVPRVGWSLQRRWLRIHRCRSPATRDVQSDPIALTPPEHLWLGVASPPTLAFRERPLAGAAWQTRF